MAKMIINGMSDWFPREDLSIDVCNLSIAILKRLLSRKVIGLKYDRLKLAQTIVNRNNYEAIIAVDKAIILLTSRKPIELHTNKKDIKSNYNYG